MNPESHGDRLENALRFRRSMAPPDEFTRAVLARVSAEPRRSHSAELLTEHGVIAGLALAASGASLVMDLNRPAAALAAVLQGPEGQTVVAVLAICVAWVLTRREPEAETL